MMRGDWGFGCREPIRGGCRLTWVPARANDASPKTTNLFAFAFIQRDILTDLTASIFVSGNLSACLPMLHMPLTLHYLDVYRLYEVRRRRALQHGPRQDHDVCFKPHVLVERRQMVGTHLTRHKLEMARATC